MGRYAASVDAVRVAVRAPQSGRPGLAARHPGGLTAERLHSAPRPPRRWRRPAAPLAVWLLGALAAACGQAPDAGTGPQYASMPADARPVYRLAVHPLHNPRKLLAVYQPLVNQWQKELPGARFEVEASRDYGAYLAKIRAREPALLLPNPWQALQAMDAGYHVVAMAGDAQDFRGLFIVRRDSPLRAPGDLRGRAVAYPAPTALAACVLPQWFLHQQGLDVAHDVEHRYVGSQESAIMSAWLGETAAAATWPPPWRAFQKSHPQEAAGLKVLWQTPPLLNNAVMVRDDVPAEVRDAVARSLYRLHESAEGRALLAGMETARFHAANDATYAPVREFIQRFEREVRPVEPP